MVLSFPLEPVGPCTPFGPTGAVPVQSPAVLFIPFVPFVGASVTEGAYDAVSTDIDATLAALADVAANAKLILCVVMASVPPTGK